jgi:hypothetical protein
MPNATYFSLTCEFGGNGGADSLVRASATDPLLPKNQVIAALEKPARGPAADQGVRPTICPGAREREKYVALGSKPALRGEVGSFENWGKWFPLL